MLLLWWPMIQTPKPHFNQFSSLLPPPPAGKNSLTRSAPLPNDSQARSGARFHTSYDKRYVIKTITSEDVAEMHNILKKYHQVTPPPLSLSTLGAGLSSYQSVLKARPVHCARAMYQDRIWHEDPLQPGVPEWLWPDDWPLTWECLWSYLHSSHLNYLK